ncbi:MAG TPA: tetratricopeptide repeat protein [Vicinamibacterales bacterium]|nr:tetratricopeptide repeat protein [Vicinamibacterales bacterium]
MRISQIAPTPPGGLRPAAETVTGRSSLRALALPLGFALALAALALLPAIRQQPMLRWSFWGASGCLLLLNAALLGTCVRRGRTLRIELVLRPQHYLQACAHLSILVYWGMYWHQVVEAVPLIAAQLMFAYAFDALLAWSRRDTYTFGFGPFPIIFSTNLFLSFKADWFYLQFLLVALGFAAKEFLRWDKGGRRVHIFNPSSFPLAVFSIVLLLTGSTGMTWGPEIATTQYNPPHIYAFIFLVALPGQFLFGVTTMTLSAVATLYGFCVAYLLATGHHYFVELPFPIAIFLGMHLLFTDPSTAPRTELGRIIFGVLYGSSVLALFALLERLGLPSFYDKLLPVPILNLLIQRIDRATQSGWLKGFDPAALGRTLAPRRRNLAYMTVWAGVFVTMQLVTGAQATLARGDSLRAQGRLDEAIVRYQEFAGSEPANFDGQRKLATALLEAGRPADALPVLHRVVDLRPNDAAAHHNLGYDLLQLGAFDRAQEQFRHALRLDADYAAAQYGLGLALWAGGRRNDSILSFRDAVRRWPASAESHYNLAAVLERNGDLDEAIDQYTRAVELNPSYVDANLSLGLIHAARGAHALAVERFRRVLQVQPDSIPAQTQLAWLLATSANPSVKNPGAAVALAEPLVARTSGRDAAALDVLAAALAATGQFDRAVTTAEQTLTALGTTADPGTLSSARDRLALYRRRQIYETRSDGRVDTP